MYNSTPFAGAVGAASALPFTGVNVLWLLLAAFTLIAAGFALIRAVPRAEA